MINFINLKKKAIICLLTFIMLIAFSLVLVYSFSTNKVIANVEFNEKYLQGQILDLPDAQLTNGSVSTTAKPIVVFPDGKVYDLSTITLNQLGEYEIRYYAEVGSIVLYKSFSFYTMASLYTVTSENSFVEYGVHKYVTNEVSGINVGLSSGDKFLYNKIINLEQLGSEASIIDLFITPSEIGYNDFSELLVTLTDVYDSENYLTVSIRSAPEQHKNVSYMKACGSGQVLTGIYHASNKIKTDMYGTQTLFSFYGQSAGQIQDDTFRLFYNSTEKTVYGKEISPDPIYSSLIIDLDDRKYFSEQWGGFTTGEVLLSVEGARYVNSKAEFVITNIAGQPLKDNLLDDEVAPEIKLEFNNENEDDLPYGIVGRPYKLFTATATDLYTQNPIVKTRVFRNYFSDKKAEFDCSKGYFIPSIAGNYIIEYTSIDDCGNIATKLLSILVENKENPMSIAIKDAVQETIAGEPITLQQVMVSGGSGHKVLKYFAIDSDNVKKEIENGETRLEKGTYRIVVEATDYLGVSYCEEYQLDVLENGIPVIISEPSILKYYISGAKYILPSVEAYDYYTDQVKEIVAKISIDEGKGEIVDKTFIPLSNGIENATLKYTLSTDAGIKELLYPITIVDTGYKSKLKVENYFIGELDSSLIDNVKGVVLSSDKEAFCEFITPLEQDFNISFGVKDNNFSRVNIILTDFFDATNKITFSYFKGDSVSDSTQFSVNDGDKIDVDANFYINSSMFNLSYSNRDKYVQFGTQDGVIVNEDVSKISKLSDKFYLTIELEEVSALSSIYVAEINGQRFSYNTVSDRIGPNIYLADELIVNFSLNETVKLVKIVSFDILDPEIKVNILVTDEAGNVLKTVDGKLLDCEYTDEDYNLQLKNYGKYIVKFTAVDTSRRSNEFTYVLSVRDDIPPTILINGDVPNSAKVNKKIYLPEGFANDNVSVNLKVSTYVITPKGKIVYIANREFVPDIEGTYLIRYVCYDDAYNVSTIDYRLIVKG